MVTQPARPARSPTPPLPGGEPPLSQRAPFQARLKPLRSSTQLHEFTPEEIVQVRCEADMVAALRRAAARQMPVRAIGAMHSYAPIFSTTGLCLVLEHYNQLLSLDIAAGKVTVQAGMTLAALNEQLAERGMALPIVSAIAQQTVAGAISTATHGGSFYHPSLSGYVRELRLVKADGSLVTLKAGEEDFCAAGVSMGLLGLISTVTLACVPAFWLTAVPQSFSALEFIERFDEIHQAHDYLDVKYVPITDNVQVLAINQADRPSPNVTVSADSLLSSSSADSPVDPLVAPLPPLPVVAPPWVRTLKTHLLKRLLALFQRPEGRWLQYWLFKRHQNNIYPAYRCDRSDRLFTCLEQVYYDPIPLHNMEIAVAYGQAPQVLKALRAHFASTRRYPNIFIRLRVSAAEPFWLSPAYGQTTCWFDFCEYPYSGQFFSELVKLLAPFNFRCHWGKEILAEPAYLQQRYERWQAFASLRDRWDPHRRFANSSLDRFFPPAWQSNSFTETFPAQPRADPQVYS